MQDIRTVLSIYREKGASRLPLERVYRQLYNRDYYLHAYGKLYRNAGAMTRGSTTETVDGMTLSKIDQIIETLKAGTFKWRPCKRVQIPKPKGGTRPLGLPAWSDKLVQEVLRLILESYYDPQFSNSSHGFRPDRSCHTALEQIRGNWTGTRWFIEGDIKGCFDNIDQTILLDTIRRQIHDDRLIHLLRQLLKAGYVEDWTKYRTQSGTPQGSIISPLLSNIYLNELDRFVENSLIPLHTRGRKRRKNPEWRRLSSRGSYYRRKGDHREAAVAFRAARRLPTVDPNDEGYRRLRYVRYADDFLLGFAGPREEAVRIKDSLAEFLNVRLRLTLSPEKTLITHAATEKARFLGFHIRVQSADNRFTPVKGIKGVKSKRSANGNIRMDMPEEVARDLRRRYSRNGKVAARWERTKDTDYTIISAYQSVLRGMYNYYCLATNVSSEMAKVKQTLELSLTKTLAAKHKCRVSAVYRKYRVVLLNGRKVLAIVIQRPEKRPLEATFGGISFVKVRHGNGNDFNQEVEWNCHASNRSEVIGHMMAEECALCGATGPVQMHHIRKLADIQKSKAKWARIMSARKRKFLPVCESCHVQIHSGQYDGPKLSGLLESVVQ